MSTAYFVLVPVSHSSAKPSLKPLGVMEGLQLCSLLLLDNGTLFLGESVLVRVSQ